MQELLALDDGKDVATNQVLYNLSRRGIEFDLLPECRRRHIPIMAYSPIEQGRVLGSDALGKIARRHGATPAQVALAWVIREQGVIAIPKSGSVEHVRENHAALAVRLTDADFRELVQAKTAQVAGIAFYMQPVQDLTVEDRISRTQYQYRSRCAG